MWNKFSLFSATLLLFCLSCSLQLTYGAQFDANSASLAVYAQADSTSVGQSASVDPTSPVWREVVKWLVAILVILYEISARFIPTSRSVSIISFIIKVLKFLFPDTASSRSAAKVSKVAESPVHDDTPRKTLWQRIIK